MGTETFAEWLDQYLQNGGRGTQARLAEQLDIRSGTITRWRDGMIPDRERIPDIARAARVPQAKIRELIEASEREQFRRTRHNVLAVSQMIEGWKEPDLVYELRDGTVVFVEVKNGSADGEERAVRVVRELLRPLHLSKPKPAEDDDEVYLRALRATMNDDQVAAKDARAEDQRVEARARPGADVPEEQDAP